MNFLELRLAEPIVRAVSACGYTVATPIQARAIPAVLAGNDLLGCARTGTGKTAAFALPILHRLAGATPRRGRRVPRALVLAPTRELAAQIDESFREYGAGLSLRTAVVFGGVGQGPQVRALRQGVDVVVATPGRLLDLVGQGAVDLGSVEVFVLDEADRMLDMGFIRDIRRIADRLPARRQTLLFSATMPREIRLLADAMLRDPVFVEAAPVSTPVEAIDQSVCHVARKCKPELLGHLLLGAEMQRSLVFTRTKHGADRLVRALRSAGIVADAIHGNKSQGQRTRALDRFKTGAAPVLVATDVASRGIDVDRITHVVNYDLPNVPETYVHRIGRTARAGAGGTAISFCDHDEREHLRAIERLIRKPLAVREHRFEIAPGTEAPTPVRNGNHDAGHRNGHGAPRADAGPSRGRRRRSRAGGPHPTSGRGPKKPRRAPGASRHACT